MDQDPSAYVPIALHYWTVGGLATGFMALVGILIRFIMKMQKELAEQSTKNRIVIKRNTEMFNKVLDRLTK